MKVAQILVLGFLFSVTTALECYDCDPLSHGQCKDPVSENEKIISCQTNDEDVFCFSIFYETGGNMFTGIYRGCIPVKDTELPCDYLKTQIPSGNITYCKTCAQNRCNSEDLTYI